MVALARWLAVEGVRRLGGDAPVANSKIQGLPVARARLPGHELRLSLEEITTFSTDDRLDVRGLFRLGFYDAQGLTDLREQEVFLIAVPRGDDVTLSGEGLPGLDTAARAWRADLQARLDQLVSDADDPASLIASLMPHEIVWCDSDALRPLVEAGSSLRSF